MKSIADEAGLASERVPPGEADAIERLRRALVARVDAEHRATGRARRDAHPKAHGLAEAVLRIDDSLPYELAVGVLRPGATYSAWVRWSNAAAADDRKRDARGVAIKLMGVRGRDLDDRARATQDLLFIDAPRFFVPDAEHFAAFVERGPRWFLHPQRWRYLAFMLGLARRARHPLGRRYFSAVPYRLGARAAKYRLVPRDRALAPARSRCPADALYEALQHHLARARFRFDLELQLFRDEATTPIEDATAIWPTPFRRVATLEIPAQSLSHGARVRLAETLSFDPWHSLREHAPLGGINRARRAVYAAVSGRRHELAGEPEVEPGLDSVLAQRAATPILDATVHAAVPQGELAVVAPVAPGREQALAELLERIDSTLPKGGGPAELRDHPLPLHRVGSLHMGRLVVVEPRAPGEPSQLVLSTNFDGDAAAHRDELVARCGAGLDAVFAHCEGYAGDVHAMLARSTRAAAFYVGARGRGVARIRAEDELRRAIEGFVDRAARPGETAAELRERIRRYVFDELDKQWLLRPDELPRMWWSRLQWGAVAVGVAIGLGPVLVFGPGWLLVPGAVAAAAYLGYRRLARADREDAAAWCTATPRRGLHEGPAPVQNWLTHCVPLRPGRLRLGVARGVLALIDLLCRARFNQGDLGGISTILFARWLILPDGRVLFFSNYAGTWSAYLDAFIDEAARGLTAVWSNAEGFPPTRPLFRDGATDGPSFKDWTRAHQQDTAVWYSAYPGLTVADINTNSRIRLGLHGAMSEAEAEVWLARLGRAS